MPCLQQMLIVTAFAGSQVTLKKSRAAKTALNSPTLPATPPQYELTKMVVTTTAATASALDLFGCPSTVLVTLESLT